MVTGGRCRNPVHGTGRDIGAYWRLFSRSRPQFISSSERHHDQCSRKCHRQLDVGSDRRKDYDTLGDDRVAGSQRFNLRRTVVRIVTCDCVRSRCTPGNRCCGWQCRTSNCICVLLRAAIDRKYPWSRGNWSASRPDCRGLILGNRIRLERKLSHRIPCVFRTEPGRRSSSELIESTDSRWTTAC